MTFWEQEAGLVTNLESIAVQTDSLYQEKQRYEKYKWRKVNRFIRKAFTIIRFKYLYNDSKKPSGDIFKPL